MDQNKKEGLATKLKEYTKKKEKGNIWFYDGRSTILWMTHQQYLGLPKYRGGSRIFVYGGQ